MGGWKIKDIAGSFSNVKRDIVKLSEKQAGILKNIKGLQSMLENSTTKDEFYDFIRELNDQFRKLEKHIATQEGLERLRKTLRTQISELETEIQARKVINKKLRTLDVLKEDTERLKQELNELASIEKKVLKIEKNYADSKGIEKRIKEILRKEHEARLVEFQEAIGDKVNLSKFIELKKNAATKQELKAHKEKLRNLVKEQARILKTQEKRIGRLETQLGKVKSGANGKGHDASSGFFGKTNLFPILVLIAITSLLVVGIVFFREDIFSPQLYQDPQSIECIHKFECQMLDDGQVLTDCSYDSGLRDCHCVAKPIELTNCSS